MRLYRTATGHWTGTIADATKAARIDADGRWDQIEVPTDKAGLIAFLNDMEARPATPAASQPDFPVQPDVAAVVEPKAPPPTPASADAVADWIMDEATPPQVEATFAALGVRFHEMRKAVQS